MTSPPTDKGDPDEGTVILPSGFQRSRRHVAEGHTSTWGPSTQSGVATAPGNALPLGTRLGEFELTRVIGEGGFGIVYEAYDSSLERRVAVKEYFPAELAERSDALRVRSLSEDDEELYAKGLQSFINEAKILARFDNASLVKVYRFWEANGTAYMVMPYYEGPTLLEALRELRQPPDEDWLRRLLEPLTEALAVIHDELIFHRDISPDNILLLSGSGRPLLLDFGAARRVINDANQKALTAIVKPGYAPIEQYSEVNMKQGPWSDVYALSAVLHFAITGKKPPAAIARLAGDAYVPLSTVAAGRYSPSLLGAIDRGLIVKPKERTQNMDAFRAHLGFAALPRDSLGLLVSSGSAPAGYDPAADTADHAPPTTRSRVAARLLARESRSVLRPPPPGDAHWGGPAVWAMLGLLAVLLVGGGLWWLLADEPPQEVATAQPPASAPATVAPAAPAGSAGELAQAGSEQRPVPPDPASPAAPATPPPFNVVDEFARVQSQSTPGWTVAIDWAGRTSFSITRKDLLRLNVRASQPGYLYVLVYTPDNVLFQYFPNTVSPANAVKAQVPQPIPRAVTDPATQLVHQGVELTDPPGKGHLLVILSRYPRDFSGLGSRRESIYPIYPVGPEAAWLQRQAANGRAIYLGQAKCPSAASCDDQFAAITDSFDIEP